jgi:hypothetical protein
MSPFGEVLVGGSLLYLSSQGFSVYSSSTVSSFSWSLPLDMSLVGLEVYSQGVCQSRVSRAGKKTYYARQQLSNALDLVLGF